MNALSLGWSPLIPLALLGGLGVLVVAALAIGVFFRAGGIAWRTLAATALLVALGNPALVIEEREPLADIGVVIVDETASQNVGTRAARTQTALEHIESAFEDDDTIELRVVRVGPGGGEAGSAPVDGSRLFGPLDRALAEIPRQRLAGAFVITDGQVHDVPAQAIAAEIGAPVHSLITGDRDEGDRVLTVVEAAKFGLVGQVARVSIRIDDPAGAGVRQARVTLRRDGAADSETIIVPVGTPHLIDVLVDRGGPSVFELEVETGPQELSLDNNRTVVVVNGVRDRLRVLLVSGQPHPGERTWRNLLKADPSVDLVHFTILRPPEKQDGTPVRELSLIAFPIRELFEIKLQEFDLIIFDNYQRRGVLPQFYLGNIANYVASGGALLEASGESFASAFSLFRTPLAEVLPGAPTGDVIEQSFRASVTEQGARHPVTATLTDPGSPGSNEPDWGRWFRQVEVEPRSGTVVMNGAPGRPLLILDRVGEGRVAQLASDQIWLWARNFDGGGPHNKLLRRMAHWLMKEPELEEDRLVGRLRNDHLDITRQSLEPDSAPVTVTFPSGRTEEVALTAERGGVETGALRVDEAGLYRLSDGTRTAVAAVGTLNPLEFTDLVATENLLRPVAVATGGGAVRLQDGTRPSLRRLPAGREMAGIANAGNRPWLGLRQNREFTVRGVNQVSLLPALITLIIGLSAALLAWRRESR